VTNTLAYYEEVIMKRLYRASPKIAGSCWELQCKFLVRGSNGNLLKLDHSKQQIYLFKVCTISKYTKLFYNRKYILNKNDKLPTHNLEHCV
jgi:hypothetical protein